jgi:hypothetical protein
VLEFPGSSVRFRYPLLRSAVYHGASAADRREAHRAWSDEGHPELRAWHLAAATVVPDEELAAELQRTAGRAGTRGGYAARAALLRRSADLTPDDARRAEREVARGRGQAHGPATRPGPRTRSAAPCPGSPVRRPGAGRSGWRARSASPRATPAEAARILASAAQALADDDRMARDTMLMALQAAIWAGPAQTREIARAARAFPPVPLLPRQSPTCCSRDTAPGFTLGYQASWSRSAPP